MKIKYYISWLSVLLYVSCTSNPIKLNDKIEYFTNFPETDSLEFVSASDSILEEPSELLMNKELLIIRDFNRANDDYISIYSPEEDKILRRFVPKGSGPNEFISCNICSSDNKLWIYDMSKSRIGSLSMDSLLCDSLNITYYKLPRYYYQVAVLNDSILLATNDLTTRNKITYINLKNGEVTGKGEYAHLADNVKLDALIDACSCYINVNPKTKDIALSYRYTDVIEIYDSTGNLKYSTQGPDGFNIKFGISARPGMRKTKETRKAFVKSYVTEDYIYLLYSGCKREETNWENGTKIFVYSWDGKPKKCYLLNQPIFTFVVDETKRIIYSYSLQTDELIKANM